MAKVAVYFSDPGAMGYPFDEEEYVRAYQELTEETAKQGGEFFIVRERSSYQGQGRFANSWQFQGEKIVETGPVQVDAVYDKGRIDDPDLESDFPAVNCKELNDICTDKWLTFQTFPELCPQNIRAENQAELVAALEKIGGEKKVVKPINLSGGEGVCIDTTAKILERQHEFPVLVQEFLDTSAGIPGIAESTHDLRLVFHDAELLYSFVRTPPAGVFIANLSYGSKIKNVPLDTLPPAALEIAAKIIRRFAQYPHSFYGVDLGFVNGTPKIIELNSRPGLRERARGSEYIRFQELLIKDLLALAQK